MVALPSPLAVTFPDLFTVATLVFDDDQLILFATLPEGDVLYFNVVEVPADIVFLVVVIEILLAYDVTSVAVKEYE